MTPPNQSAGSARQSTLSFLDFGEYSAAGAYGNP